MKSPKFSPRPKRPKLLIRRVVGKSMEPTLRPGQIVIGIGFYRKLAPGNAVIVSHSGLEKIKRIEKIEGEHVYLLGDNLSASTDSRTWGWLPLSSVQAKVVWPLSAN